MLFFFNYVPGLCVVGPWPRGRWSDRPYSVQPLWAQRCRSAIANAAAHWLEEGAGKQSRLANAAADAACGRAWQRTATDSGHEEAFTAVLSARCLQHNCGFAKARNSCTGETPNSGAGLAGREAQAWGLLLWMHVATPGLGFDHSSLLHIGWRPCRRPYPDRMRSHMGRSAFSQGPCHCLLWYEAPLSGFLALVDDQQTLSSVMLPLLLYAFVLLLLRVPVHQKLQHCRGAVAYYVMGPNQGL